MARPVSLLGRIWLNFKNSFGAPFQKTTCVGEDHLGNTYFQKEPDPSRNLRGGRWVETQDGDQFKSPNLPVEWEAWLRLKRQTPPSKEELKKNYVNMMKIQARVKELEMKEQKTLKNVTREEPSSLTSEIEPNSDTRKFPIYEEFENTPGQKTPTHKQQNS